MSAIGTFVRRTWITQLQHRPFFSVWPPILGGGGMPHRIIVNKRPPSIMRTTGAG